MDILHEIKRTVTLQLFDINNNGYFTINFHQSWLA